MKFENRACFFCFYPLIQLIVLSNYILSDAMLNTVFMKLNNTWLLTSESCHLGGQTTSQHKLPSNVIRAMIKMYKSRPAIR